MEHVRRGALLHDIGKIGISDTVLLKPGRLTSEERAIVRQHPVFAYDVLSPIDFLKPALDIPSCHHERWGGLAGDAIPLAARLFAVVDVWDAMRSDRPYHVPRSRLEVRVHVQAGSGSHFDPAVIDVFLRLEADGEFEDIYPEPITV